MFNDEAYPTGSLTLPVHQKLSDMTDRHRGIRPRQHTYFINGTGIDREVITTDICRYLGNDCLVKPGSHQDKATGQIQEGYYITAYRPPTSEQLQELRTDTILWREERRNFPDPQNSYGSSATRQGAPSTGKFPPDSGKVTVVNSYNAEAIQAGPPTDSGYASATHHKLELTQDARAEDHTHSTANIQSQPHIDEGYSSTSNNMSKDAQIANDLAPDDVRTVYSDTSSLPGLESESYISELADNLLSEVRSLQLDAQTMERISEILPGLLKAFALKIGYDAPTQMHRDVMFFVHKYRNDIVRYFKSRYFHEEESLPGRHTGDPNKMPLEDRISHWYRNMEHPLDDVPQPDIYETDADHLTGEISNEEVEEENNMPELREYRNFIFKNPAYEWLLVSLRRELLLVVEMPNTMEAIRNRIIDFLPPSQKITKKKSADTCTMRFEVDWNPIVFVQEQQYSEPQDEAIEIAITLTGSAKNAQALICAQYLYQTWPSTGEHIIRLVKDVVRRDLAINTHLVAWIHASSFIVVALGTRASVAEIGEQLAWLGAALRSSPYESGISYCTPFISAIGIDNTPSSESGLSLGSKNLCKIDFTVQEGEKNFKSSNGQCWHNMFRNPVVVKGYPILRKPEPDTGIEIPLNMMAGLVRTQHANIFDGQLFIKGFSTMLVPTKHNGDQVIWHLLYNKDGHRISYLDNNIPHAENVSFSDLEKARHVIGWCSEVRNYAGAVDAKYTIDRSKLPGPHAGCVLEKISISGGQFITGGITFGIGSKDTPLHVSRHGYIPKLQWISKKFVVLWDEEDKRGWLVNGTSALLHLLRTSLEYNKTDKFKSAFLFKSEEIEEASVAHVADSAIEVLLNPTNMKIKIYPDKGEMYDEETRRENTELEAVSKKKKSYLRLEDRVEHLYGIMEKIIDHQIAFATQKGMKLKFAVRSRLEGWDFMDLATGRDPFYPRVATLHNTGKGWVDFARSIHAVTLFGRGFGEIIQPVDTSISCPRWSKLPKGNYHLAVCVSDIKEIMDLDGDMDVTPMKLSDDIIWYNPDKVFEPCQCKKRFNREHSEFVQVLLPSRFRTILPKMNPVRLEDRGAVIFGQNVKFRWHWKDFGEPEEGEAPPSSAESETGVFNSGIGSNLGLSGTEENKCLSGLSSQLPSVEASSSIPLSTPATSEATVPNGEELQLASIQEHENLGSDDTKQRRQNERSKWSLSYMFKKVVRGRIGSV